MDRKDASRLARASKGNRAALLVTGWAHVAPIFGSRVRSEIVHLSIPAGGGAEARDAATERLGVVASAIVPVGDGTALFYGGELARNKRLPCVLSVAPKTGVVCDAPLWTGESDELDATSFCAGAKRGEEFLFFGGLDRYFRVTSLLRSAVSIRKKTGTSKGKKYLFRSYKASDDTPSPRYGCSFTYFAESGETFLFGGFTASQAGSLAVVADDAKLYVLSSRDADADPWERTSPGVWSAVGGATGTGPGPRGLHACVAIRSTLLLGGGLCDPKGPLCAEEVHAFDVDAKVWSTLAFDGPSVGLRYCHAMLHDGDDGVIVFGGSSSVSELPETTNALQHFRLDGGRASLQALAWDGPSSPRCCAVLIPMAAPRPSSTVTFAICGGYAGSAGRLAPPVSPSNLFYLTTVEVSLFKRPRDLEFAPEPAPEPA